MIALRARVLLLLLLLLLVRVHGLLAVLALEASRWHLQAMVELVCAVAKLVLLVHSAEVVSEVVRALRAAWDLVILAHLIGVSLVALLEGFNQTG